MRSHPRRAVVVTVGLGLLAAAAAGWSHRPCLSALALSVDDDQYLTRNPLVQNPSWRSTWFFLSEVLEPTTVRGYYQPLTMISLMLDHAAGGSTANLRPFRRTSLLLHCANTTLVFVFLTMLFRNPLAAFAAALLFGLHPLTVEPIAWTGDRKTLLAAFFCQISLIAYVACSRKRSGAAYAVVIMAYLAALMSKPTAIALPLALILLDWWPLRRFSRRSVVEKLPLFGLLAVSAFVTFVSQERTAAVVLPQQQSVMQLVLLLPYKIAFYAGRIVCPVNLSSHYPIPRDIHFAQPAVLLSVLATAAIVAAALMSLRRTRAVAAGIAIFGVLIFPSLGVVRYSDVVASDKFVYLPSIGLLCILAWAFDAVQQRLRQKWPRSIAVGLPAAAVLLAAAAEVRATRRYYPAWHDTDTLFRRMLSLAPESDTLMVNIGALLIDQQRPAEALPYFEKAAAVNPHSHDAWVNQGLALQALGRIDEAILKFEQALRSIPNSGLAHYDLGLAFFEANRTDSAIEHFRRAVLYKPRFAEAHYNLAVALASIGDLQQALMETRAALADAPRDADALCLLGYLLAQQGDNDRAIAALREALRINPTHARAGAVLDALLTPPNQSAD